MAKKYSLEQILKVNNKSNVKSRSPNQSNTIMKHTCTPKLISLLPSYILQFSKICPSKNRSLPHSQRSNEGYNIIVSLQQCQSSNKGHTVMLQTNSLTQCPLQFSTYYTLQFLRFRSDKMFPQVKTWIKQYSHRLLLKPTIEFLHLEISKILLRVYFKGQGHKANGHFKFTM